MRNGFDARVEAIGKRLPEGCPTCRSWSHMHLDNHTPDQPFTPPSRPEHCPTCGRHLPITFIRELLIVDDRYDGDMDGAA